MKAWLVIVSGNGKNIGFQNLGHQWFEFHRDAEDFVEWLKQKDPGVLVHGPNLEVVPGPRIHGKGERPWEIK